MLDVFAKHIKPLINNDMHFFNDLHNRP